MSKNETTTDHWFNRSLHACFNRGRLGLKMAGFRVFSCGLYHCFFSQFMSTAVGCSQGPSLVFKSTKSVRTWKIPACCIIGPLNSGFSMNQLRYYEILPFGNQTWQLKILGLPRSMKLQFAGKIIELHGISMEVPWNMGTHSHHHPFMDFS